MRYRELTQTTHKDPSQRRRMLALFMPLLVLALLVSGLTMFAAPPGPSLSLDQATNGGIGKTPVSPVGWENGNQNGQKAHYNEGESIPYRARIANLIPGETYRATFGYDIKHSGKHAIDFITGNQRIAEVVDPCNGTGEPVISPCVAGTPGLIPSPAASAGVFFNLVVGFEGAQFVKIFNGNISLVEYITQGNESAAQAETTFRVTFTASSSTAILSWGGHIARGVDWGAGQGATGLPGSPYHTRAKQLDVPNGMGGFNAVSIGNQDRALASSAVLPPAMCSLTNNGARACGSSNLTHELTGAASTSATYSFSFVSGGATAMITASNVNPSAASCTDGDPGTPCIFATVSATAGYTLRLSVSNPSGVETCDAVVTIDQQPVAADVANQEHCDQGALSDKEFNLSSAGSTVPAGGSIMWSVVSGMATIESPNSASTKVTITSGSTATIRLTVAGPGGTTCPNATDDAVLTLNPAPTVSISLQNECNAGTAALKANASGGTGTLHYQWQKDGVNVGGDSDTLPVSAVGTYSVTVTDGKTCVGMATKKLCFTLQNAP